MAVLLGDSLLRERLDAKGWTQSYFAERMGCSRSYVSGLISGSEKMSLEFAINTSILLDCNVTDLYVLIPSRSRKGRK